MSPKILCLFDVDGTLTKSRQVIDEKTYDFLQNQLKECCDIALVGGSDFKKIAEQMNGDDVIKRFDHVFAENGLIYYRNGEKMTSNSIVKHVGEEKLQKFINFCLSWMSKIMLPVKRGTFVEFRTGMINISPIGRSCSQAERDEFEIYDKKHGIRIAMIEAIKAEFPDLELTYSIGGQISFDVFPNGWDKTYCLGHLEQESYDEVHFFGDKVDRGGNDYEIYVDRRVVGHKVENPDDTVKQLKQLFNLQ